MPAKNNCDGALDFRFFGTAYTQMSPIELRAAGLEEDKPRNKRVAYSTPYAVPDSPVTISAIEAVMEAIAFQEPSNDKIFSLTDIAKRRKADLILNGYKQLSLGNGPQYLFHPKNQHALVYDPNEGTFVSLNRPSR